MSTTRLTWYPAALSADALAFDTAPGGELRLLRIAGIGGIGAEPLLAKGPSQEGSTALDVAIGMRTVNCHAMMDTATRAELLALRATVARSMVSIPVRFGAELELGRLLLERSDASDVELYALPRSAKLDYIIGSAGRGLADLEWLAPYPYWRDTADSEVDLVTTTSSITGVAATNLITATDHDLATGDAVTFTALTGGAGLVTGTTYYVIASGLTANDFRVSATPGGTEVDFTTAITDGTVAQLITAVNAGDVDAPVVATVYGAATSVTLTNVTTGEELTVAVALTNDTQWLQVDTTPGVKTIRKYTAVGVWSNAIAGLDLGSPRLWQLQPGNNSLRLTVAGGSATTRATIAWRNRYAGV